MTNREEIISHLQIIRAWAKINPEFGRGLDLQDCRKTVVWIDDALQMIHEADWKDIGQEQPEIGQRCITYHEDGTILVGAWSEYGFTCPCYCKAVTHWMPVPQPPKGGDDGCQTGSCSL